MIQFIKTFFSENRLFIKILFWFWSAALLVSIIFFVAPAIFNPGYFPGGWRDVTDTALDIYGQSAAQISEQQGVQALENYLSGIENKTKIRSFLLNSDQSKINSSAVPDKFSMIINKTFLSDEPQFEGENFNTLLSARKISTDNHHYLFLNEIPRDFSNSVFAVDLKARIFRVSLIILTSFLVCFWLTRHLTSPIIKLDYAARQIAQGDLSARIGSNYGRRNDEFTTLIKNFDQMAEQLESLMKSQSRLLGDISHELRSPLARLRVAATLARDGDKIEVEDAIDVIEREAANINAMIDQLMTLTRLETLNRQTNFTEFDLAQLVREIAADAEFETLDKNKAIQINKLESHKMKGDRKLMRSAIENVVRNAIKYTAENTAVEIDLSNENEKIVLSIRDHGEGVPESALSKLFLPFYRMEDDRDRLSGGTGLGLSIAERSVKIHQGTITAQNSVEGGLMVKILLPKS